jgi:hypothetical protein
MLNAIAYVLLFQMCGEDRAQVAVKAERKRQQVQAAQKKLQRAAAAQI